MPSFGLPYRAVSPRIRLLLKIEITYPSAATLYFSDAPIFDAAINAAGSSVGLATAVLCDDLSPGTVDNRIRIGIRNMRYWGLQESKPNWARDDAATPAGWQVTAGSVACLNDGMASDADPTVTVDGSYPNWGALGIQWTLAPPIDLLRVYMPTTEAANPVEIEWHSIYQPNPDVWSSVGVPAWTLQPGWNSYDLAAQNAGLRQANGVRVSQSLGTPVTLGEFEVYEKSEAVYDDLVSLLRTYSLHGAKATLTQYVDAHGYAESRVLLAGSWTEETTVFSNAIVDNVTDITPTSLTLEIAEGANLDVCLAPDIAIARGALPSWNWDPPLKSKGLSLPLRMGPMTRVPIYWETEYGTDLDKIVPWIYHGVTMPGILPSRLLKDQDGTADPIWVDMEQPTDLAAYSEAGSYVRALTYIPSLDSFGRIMGTTIWANDTTAAADGYYSHSAPKAREVTAHLVPVEVAAYTGGGAVTNWMRACDRKMDTFATIAGTDALIRFKIPTVGDLGTIRPIAEAINLVCYTTLRPVGEVTDATGNFSLSIRGPYGTAKENTVYFTAPLNLACGVSGWRTSTVSGGDGYPPTDDWVGTQIQQWRFELSGTSDAADRDSILWDTADTAGTPLEIVAKLEGTGRLYLFAVALQIRFALGIDDYVPYVNRNMPPQEGRLWDRHHYRPDWGPAPRDVGRNRREEERNLWDRRASTTPRRSMLLVKPVVDEPTDPENTYTIFPPLYDASDVYGGGVGAVRSPGATANFLMREYTDPPNGLVVGDTSTFGTVKCFDYMVQQWAGRSAWPQGAPGLEFWTHERQSVGAHVAQILAHCPGKALRTTHTSAANAGKPALSLMTWDRTIDLTRIAHACVAAGGLSAHRDILRDAQGIPRIEVQFSRTSDVINDIAVQYDFDQVRRIFRRTAYANALGQDDGYGIQWPNTPPYGDYRAMDVCALSEELYGRRRKFTLDLPYISREDMAIAAAASALWFGWRPRATLRLHCSASCQDIVPGQLISLNDDVRTAGGVANPVPFRNDNTWTDFCWYVLSCTRIDQGDVYYEIYATEHLNNAIMGNLSTQLKGGVALEVGDGFDG